METLQYPIINTRFMLRDLPMALVLTIFLLGALSNSSSMELIIILIYVGVSLLQALCCYISKQWPRESKHVDYKKVAKAIQDRILIHKQKREAGGNISANEEQKISNDTDKSNGLDQFNEQLSALNKSNELDSGLGDT